MDEGNKFLVAIVFDYQERTAALVAMGGTFLAPCIIHLANFLVRIFYSPQIYRQS